MIEILRKILRIIGGRGRVPRRLEENLDSWGLVPGIAAFVAAVAFAAIALPAGLPGFWFAVVMLALGPVMLVVFGLARRPG